MCSINKLKEIVIPDDVELAIDRNTFSGNFDLNSVYIGNGVTRIGNVAFAGCGRLTSVKIGNSVTSIGESAFASCSSLKDLELGNAITSIGKEAFADCGLETLIVPSGEIGEEAFGYNKLKNVIIEENVTQIGKYAFSGNYDLENATIKSGTIKSRIFYQCGKLRIINIKKGVSSIESDAFEYGSITGAPIQYIRIENGSNLTVPANKWGAENATVITE